MATQDNNLLLETKQRCDDGDGDTLLCFGNMDNSECEGVCNSTNCTLFRDL